MDMKKYSVAIETREQGAIGNFEIRTFIIEACGVMCEIDALFEQAMHKAHSIGFETRFPSKIVEIDKS